MCEECRTKQEMMRQEIRDLANGEGDLYEHLAEISLSEKDEDRREHILCAVVTKAIALRAAMIAHLTDPDLTEEGGLPPSMILGMWAGWAMTAEMDHAQMVSAVEEMFKGLNFN